MKYIRWIFDNALLICTFFLLVFIPLYPKRPLLDIVNTWVYIRAEDFVVLIVLAVWLVQLFRKKISFNTPLTVPILLFWTIGAIVTFHGILIIFPTISGAFPNVALLSYIRRIEYISLFFISFASVKDRRVLSYLTVAMLFTFFAVCAYGFGQRYFGFPAFLTMNEEVAKGIPIRLSAMARVPSTFGGHYDLAAYLVLVIPIFASLIFGIKNWFAKILLIFSVLVGFALLFLTVSRISFFAIIISLLIVLFFQKRRVLLLMVPLTIILIVSVIHFSPALIERFGSTIKEVDVLVEAKTGNPIGHPKEVPSSYFTDKIVRFRSIKDKNTATSAAFIDPDLIIPQYLLPPTMFLVKEVNTSTGESLPEGSSYINLPLSTTTKRLYRYFLEDSRSNQVFVVDGEYIIKRALAYDQSFTTRFQGEWPKSLDAFKRNILFGSGYGSVSLAVDNNYLRILAETGIIGFVGYFALFVATGVYIRKLLPEVTSPFHRSFIVGYAAGGVGLMINAVLFDIFEASKVAFYLWLLTGIVFAVLVSYQKKKIDLIEEFKRIAFSPWLITLYLFVFSMLLYSAMIKNYFIGDDFTWFRWIADCQNETCGSLWNYFIHAGGFFYRPGTKVFFYAMYKIFWLNQTIYHSVSILLHFIASVLVFLISKKIFNSKLLGAISGFLFLLLSSHIEAIFWISSIGFLFVTVFILVSLLFFIAWDGKRRHPYFVLCLASMVLGLLFHELGVITPLILLVYKATLGRDHKLTVLKTGDYVILFAPIFIYLLVRYSAQSHWFSGDYNYNLVRLPFNIVGNIFGYLMNALIGPMSMGAYNALRAYLKENMLIALFLTITFLVSVYFVYKKLSKALAKEEGRILMFGILMYLTSLIPFLGLGNMTSRYSYLSSVGFVIIATFALHKLYTHIYQSGRTIAYMTVAITFSLFSLFHIIQIQKSNGDWHTAGQKVENFFISIDSHYQDYWSMNPIKFYFVDVPIKSGDAWVFPVGLPDAVWFSYRGPSISVFQPRSIEEAQQQVDILDTNSKVFIFQDSGRVFDYKNIEEIISP